MGKWTTGCWERKPERDLKKKSNKDIIETQHWRRGGKGKRREKKENCVVKKKKRDVLTKVQTSPGWTPTDSCKKNLCCLPFG